MDPLAALQSRIEQLEARLMSATMTAEPVQSQETVSARGSVSGGGESATEALLAAASYIDTATAGQDKLAAATQRASELNNYTDPNFIQNVQQSEMKAQEILASEPAIKHHCRCMQQCQKAEPVLESEALQSVPQMQAELTQLQASASQLRNEAECVGAGVAQVAETCGAAAGAAADALIGVAKQVDSVEAKILPKRRNGLD